ncbi:MAG: NADH-quinone oxidoreductase subunit I [Rubrobacteridae bacterium]|nr:NADH-quinone oxidoreductase subunit I [Rubrobacteridae bacterium]
MSDKKVMGFFEAWKSIFTGLRITMKRVRKPEQTLLYPFEKPKIEERFRGAPYVYQYLGESDEKDRACIACGICVKTCPVNCINVVRDKEKGASIKVAEWDIDLTKCMFCGLCTEVCPTNALRMSHDYENAEYSKDNLIYDRERAARRPLVIRTAEVVEES